MVSAASDITAFVIDDPDAVFLIDADAAFTRADLYKNYSVTNTTGVTQTGISKQQLDVSVSGTATTFAIQAIDISQDPENSDTVLLTQIFLLESTITSTEVEQV